MKNIHDLLVILKSGMETHFSSTYNDGMCLVAVNMWIDREISKEDYETLISYIRNNRPINLFRSIRSNYFWAPGRLTPRMKWINKHIKLTR